MVFFFLSLCPVLQILSLLLQTSKLPSKSHSHTLTTVIMLLRHSRCLLICFFVKTLWSYFTQTTTNLIRSQPFASVGGATNSLGQPFAFLFKVTCWERVAPGKFLAQFLVSFSRWLDGWGDGVWGCVLQINGETSLDMAKGGLSLLDIILDMGRFL